MTGESRTWVLDEVEERAAAVEEDGAALLHVPAWVLPDGAREGDVLRVERRAEDDGSVTLRIRVDRAATDAALRRSREQLERMAGGDAGGDIVL